MLSTTLTFRLSNVSDVNARPRDGVAVTMWRDGSNKAHTISSNSDSSHFLFHRPLSLPLYIYIYINISYYHYFLFALSHSSLHKISKRASLFSFSPIYPQRIMNYHKKRMGPWDRAGTGIASQDDCHSLRSSLFAMRILVPRSREHNFASERAHQSRALYQPFPIP